MVWSDGFPSPTDAPDGRLPSLLTTQKIAFRTGVEKHSFWTDSSLASAGVPRLSMNSFGPGSCRAYFGTASSLSTAVTTYKPITGRLFITSDTSRLYTWVPAQAEYGFLDNEKQVLVGSRKAITWQVGSQVTMQTNCRVVVQVGSTPMTVSSVTTIAFPVGYAATAPTIQLQAMSGVATAMVQPTLTSSGTTNFSISGLTFFGTVSDFTILWRSHGTAAL